ncbi:OmpA family protein [Fluviicola chungangensis]|uniref:OmpA family protein n=1 Tax=Fluviicola chungangensis TaxID=2597671 RepID=A0A556N0U5_9FLAO|nr:OmpA family protein [Fluviicola chungangensis]TSJ45810.1 OmpA family protein [Fluviicola chungangensis]
MKIYHLLFICLPFALNAQNDVKSMNKWSLGLSIGAHDGMAPSRATTRLYQIHHYGINTRYMFTNRAGITLGVNYDFLDFINKPFNSYYFRTSLEGVVNAGDMLHFPQVMPRIGLLVHGGFGFSSLWSDNNPRIANTESLSKRADGMINFTFGATPQVKLNERWSLNGDLSFIFHARQNNTFDMQRANKKGSIDGYMLNLSIGVSYYLGKNKTHADWTPTIYGAAGPDSKELDRMKAELAALKEQARDDDKDGVPNSIDQEANTPAGSFVDSKGVAIKDTDGDGITDAYDACPDVKGVYSANGCPDSDKDGVPDGDDACPQTPGLVSNNGCPVVEKAVQEVMAKALRGVQFETSKSTLLKTSLPILDEVVRVMKQNPDYRLDILGHTDNVGDENQNLVLSQERAQVVAAYLISKGVDSARIHAKGFGESQPKTSNDTPEGQAINRRVEFNVVFD